MHQEPQPQLSCLICGRFNCQESYDHLKFTQSQLDQILSQNKVEDLSRQNLCNQVQHFYDCLLEEVVKSIQNDKQYVLSILKKMDYPALNSNPNVSMDLLGELASGNYSSLPSTKLIPIIEAFQVPTAKNANVIKNHSQTYQVIQDYLEVENFIHKKNLFCQSLLSPILHLQKQKNRQLSRKVSIRQCENPEQLISLNQNVRVDIKGRIMTEKSIEVEINNRNVTDNDIVSSINQLKRLKLLTKIEARNNRITSLTCKMLAFNLPHLKKLDIRGNNVGDQGALVISRNIRGLNELYVCENQITDATVEDIYQNLKQLNLLWMQNNKISFAGASLIITLEGLRAVSMHGNLFSKDEGQALKMQFLGYISA